MSLFFVYLRQPNRLDDRRDDPFWEFGSFGSTGCHRTNLLHIARCPIKPGDRLVFLQGGRGEIRVVGLTPPVITVRKCGVNRCEVIWPDTYSPMRFDKAPALITNNGETAFPAVFDLLKGVRKSSFCGKTSSKLRSSKQPISSRLSDELISWFESDNASEGTAGAYIEAVTYPDSPWYLNAARQTWHEQQTREHNYRTLIGFPTKSRTASAKLPRR